VSREVALPEQAWQSAALDDLDEFLYRHVATDRRIEGESSLLRQLGEWIGVQVLGGDIVAEIAGRAPVTLLLQAPPTPRFLSLPVELAWLGDAPLLERGVVPVFDPQPVRGPASHDAVAGRPASDRSDRGTPLRILAIFSQPDRSTALPLRRERRALSRLVQTLGADHHRRVELTVLQYGVTREQVRQAVGRAEGWDILHVSAHGSAGVVVLERPDGRPDAVDAAALVDLLRPARGSTKLTVVSSCESASSPEEELARLGLPVPGRADRTVQDAPPVAAMTPAVASAARHGRILRSLASELVDELDCAVVGMRYPVDDAFAVRFTGEFYHRLLVEDDPVENAMGHALHAARWNTGSGQAIALSVVAPLLLGRSAIGLRLSPSPGDPPADRHAGHRLPDEPAVFVGRTAQLARAQRALAPLSGRTAVLFHGMAGAGKSACAAELAHRQLDVFEDAIWWTASRDGEGAAADALADFAGVLQHRLPDPDLAALAGFGEAASWTQAAERVTSLMSRTRLLLIVDDLESLLDSAGAWRDPRWAAVVRALTVHSGESRTVLTSRLPLPGMDHSAIAVEEVHPLSLEEAVLLVEELPRLSRLLAQDDADGRDLLHRVLLLTQGHPKLLEIADGAAADRAELAGWLDAMGSEGSARRVIGTAGARTPTDADFDEVLARWTAGAVDRLPDAARRLLVLLCWLEDRDHLSVVAEMIWADAWPALGGSGPAPALTDGIRALEAAALLRTERSGTTVAEYTIHPAVASTVRRLSGPDAGKVVDEAAADSHSGAFQWALTRPEGEAGTTVVAAGIRAAPYLLRQGKWEQARAMLEQCLTRQDDNPADVGLMLPYLRRIAEHTGRPGNTVLLGRALALVAPAEGERLLRQAFDRAATDADRRTAYVAAVELYNVLFQRGRFDEAQAAAEAAETFAAEAGLGAWNEIEVAGLRLQALARSGEHERVLVEVDGLVHRLRDLPTERTARDATNPWNVTETTLDIGRQSALELGRWEDALWFTAEILSSIKRREGGQDVLARTRFSDYGPLIELGRLDEAEQTIESYQDALDDDDLQGLSMVLQARAALADHRGHLGLARQIGSESLRMAYLTVDSLDIARSHQNLARYLRQDGEQAPADLPGAYAHLLAACVLYLLVGAEHVLDELIGPLARMCRSIDEPVPESLATLIAWVERVPGVRFGEVVVESAESAVAQAALAAIQPRIATALDEELRPGLASAPFFQAVVAAGRGGAEAAAEVRPELLRRQHDPTGQKIMTALLLVLAGEREHGRILPPPNSPRDAAIVRILLDMIDSPDPPDQVASDAPTRPPVPSQPDER